MTSRGCLSLLTTFYGVCRKGLQAVSRHSYGYKFSPISVCTHEEFIESMLSTWKKWSSFRFKLIYRYIDKIPDYENHLGQIYPAGLEIKDITYSITSSGGAYSQGKGWIIKRLAREDAGGVVDLTLPFAPNETIQFPHHKLSVSEYKCSYIPKMEFYLTTCSIRPGLLLILMFYFEGQATFQ